jgi:hypothetical protein
MYRKLNDLTRGISQNPPSTRHLYRTTGNSAEGGTGSLWNSRGKKVVPTRSLERTVLFYKVFEYNRTEILMHFVSVRLGTNFCSVHFFGDRSLTKAGNLAKPNGKSTGLWLRKLKKNSTETKSRLNSQFPRLEFY